MAQRALEIYQRSQDALRRGDWATYGTEQKRLEEKKKRGETKKLRRSTHTSS